MSWTDEETYAQTRLPVELASTLNPEAYRSDDYFESEQAHLFANSWVAVGFIEQVTEPGHVLVCSVAGRSVIIVRDLNGQLNAFLNVCRHRGAQLITEDCTLAKRIRCPYHAWAYGFDGECLGTPLFEGSGIPEEQQPVFDMSATKEFDRADYGLFPVSVDTWAFLVFVNIDGSAGPLTQWLGDLPDRMAGYGLEEWKTQAVNPYDIAANWKLIAENFMEYYHLPWVHPELMKVSRMDDHYRWQGPGMYTAITTTPVTQDDKSGWLDLPPQERITGSDRISGRHVTLFPNVAISFLPNHAFVIMLDPRNPNRTIETTTVLTHPDSVDTPTAPEGLDKLLRFWDEVNREDIAIVERVQIGLSTPEYQGGRMCYHFEEPVHRFQNMVIDRMCGIDRIPPGDTPEIAARFGPPE